MKKNNNSSSNKDYVDLTSRGSKNKKSSDNTKKKKRNIKLIMINTITSLVLVLSTLVLSGSLFIYTGSTLGPGEDPGVDPAPPPDNILPPNQDVTYFLVAGLDQDEVLTDVLMVVCFDTKANTASILQIPRDTYVSENVPTGKVNAVYGNPKDGRTNIQELERAIEKYFCLPIDYYFTVTLDAFKEIVDAIGGVPIVLEEPMEIANFEEDYYYTLEAGPHTLNGVEAEGYIRDRNDYVNGDLGRENAQRAFYASFANEMLNMNLLEMIDVGKTCLKYVESNMDNSTLMSYASEAQELELYDIYISTLPGSSGYASPMGVERSYYSINKQLYADLVNERFNPYNSPLLVENIQCPELFDSSIPSEAEEGTFADYMS